MTHLWFATAAAWRTTKRRFSQTAIHLAARGWRYRTYAGRSSGSSSGGTGSSSVLDRVDPFRLPDLHPS
jgi:hypothetical protein